jgi:hypothetical protein
LLVIAGLTRNPLFIRLIVIVGLTRNPLFIRFNATLQPNQVRSADIFVAGCVSAR